MAAGIAAAVGERSRISTGAHSRLQTPYGLATLCTPAEDSQGGMRKLRCTKNGGEAPKTPLDVGEEK